VFPSGLFDDCEAGLVGRSWAVAYVRSRQEGVYVSYLGTRDIPHYAPYRLQSARSAGRVRSWRSPLFPGYVFVWGDDGQQSVARRSDVLVAMIPVLDQMTLLSELRSVHGVLRNGAPVIDRPDVQVGALVDIVDGALAGCRGTIERTRGALRFVVSVSLLRRSIAVELDRDTVLPVRAAV